MKPGYRSLSGSRDGQGAPSLHHKKFVLADSTWWTVLWHYLIITYQKKSAQATQPLEKVLCMKFVWSELGVA